MPILEQNIHTVDLEDERRRAQRWFWYYLCLYVEDERENEGQICDALHAYIQILDNELQRRQSVKHWKPGTHTRQPVSYARARS